MSTPPIPQTMVSQIGMLSRSPGAKNLPSAPMIMPAMITPMRSTATPSPVGDGLVPGVAGVPVRPRAQTSRGIIALLRFADPSLNTRGTASTFAQPPTSQGSMPLEGMVTGIGDPLHAIYGMPWRTPLLRAFAAGQG